MRNINSSALAEIAKLGTKPINIVRVYWTENYVDYSDKKVSVAPTLQGKILKLDQIENVINLSKGSGSHNVSVLLDDADGSIKNILNGVDVHKRPVQILQWFENLPLSEAFILFEGVVSSPIVWKEGDRTVAFDIVTKLEEHEIGFSFDEGEFSAIPQDLIGKALPMVFGLAVNVPVVQLDKIPTGTTTVPVGIPDRTLPIYLEFIKAEQAKQLSYAQCLSSKGADMITQGSFATGDKELRKKGEELQRRAREIIRQVSDTIVRDFTRLHKIKVNQEIYDLKTIKVIGGSEFIQGRQISVKIGEAHYRGSFSGNTFAVSSRRPPIDNTYREVGAGLSQQDQQGQKLTIYAPEDDFISDSIFGPKSVVNQVSDDEVCVEGKDWFFYSTQVPSKPVEKENFWFAEAGASVTVDTDYPIRYICSITPVSILGVAAYKAVAGVKKLVAVPNNFYSVSTETYGAVTLTILTLAFPLSTLEKENWDDTIYVTMKGSIGPNIVDVMSYLINTYSDLSIDSVSFNLVRNQIPTAANFYFEEKSNILSVLKEIAFQAMCFLYIKENKVYLKYLPIESSPIETITETDVDLDSLEVTYSKTEDLVTKFVAEWQQDYAKPRKNKFIAKFNVAKYGIQERSEDFYIYNNQIDVEIAVSFWLNRLGHTWKKLRLKSFLHKLKIESLDTVTLNFSNSFISFGSIDGICELATYNSDDFKIDLEFWLPIVSGSMVKYEPAFPDSTLNIFPTEQEIAAGFEGSRVQASGEIQGPIPLELNVVRTRKQQARKVPQSDAPRTDNQIQLTVVAPGVVATPINPQARVNKFERQNRQQPQYRYQYSEPTRPGATTLSNTGLSYIGRVGSKVGPNPKFSGGIIYNVTIFPGGNQEAGEQIQATQMQQRTESTIPPNTPVIVVRRVFSEKVNGTTVYRSEYFFQVPVWLIPPASV